MIEREKHTRENAIERDEKPELDDAWFREADAYVGEKLVRRGRPKAANPKVAVSLRLDPDVLAWFKHTGGEWQTRINEALRKAAGI